MAVGACRRLTKLQQGDPRGPVPGLFARGAACGARISARFQPTSAPAPRFPSPLVRSWVVPTHCCWRPPRGRGSAPQGGPAAVPAELHRTVPVPAPATRRGSGPRSAPVPPGCTMGKPVLSRVLPGRGEGKLLGGAATSGAAFCAHLDGPGLGKTARTRCINSPSDSPTNVFPFAIHRAAPH